MGKTSCCPPPAAAARRPQAFAPLACTMLVQLHKCTTRPKAQMRPTRKGSHFKRGCFVVFGERLEVTRSMKGSKARSPRAATSPCDCALLRAHLDHISPHLSLSVLSLSLPLSPSFFLSFFLGGLGVTPRASARPTLSRPLSLAEMDYSSQALVKTVARLDILQSIRKAGQSLSRFVACKPM